MHNLNVRIVVVLLVLNSSFEFQFKSQSAFYRDHSHASQGLHHQAEVIVGVTALFYHRGHPLPNGQPHAEVRGKCAPREPAQCASTVTPYHHWQLAREHRMKHMYAYEHCTGTTGTHW